MRFPGEVKKQEEGRGVLEGTEDPQNQGSSPVKRERVQRTKILVLGGRDNSVRPDVIRKIITKVKKIRRSA